MSVGLKWTLFHFLCVNSFDKSNNYINDVLEFYKSSSSEGIFLNDRKVAAYCLKVIISKLGLG